MRTLRCWERPPAKWNPLCIAVDRKQLSVGVAGHEFTTSHGSTKGQHCRKVNPQVQSLSDQEARKAESWPVVTASMWPSATNGQWPVVKDGDKQLDTAIESVMYVRGDVPAWKDGGPRRDWREWDDNEYDRWTSSCRGVKRKHDDRDWDDGCSKGRWADDWNNGRCDDDWNDGRSAVSWNSGRDGVCDHVDKRHGINGGRKRFCERGGKAMRDWYKGFYQIKGRGRGAMKDYIRLWGPPPEPTSEKHSWST